MAVGTLRNVAAQRTDMTIALTGERVTSASFRAELDYQVLEIATRRVKWAGSIRTGSSSGFGAILNSMVTRMGQEITQTIYPMRLIRADDPNELVVNQGGVTVEAGQRFRIFALGAELTDPYTRESLGRTEKEVGVVQIQRVDPRVSYARLVSGALPAAGAEAVLRPAAAAPAAQVRSAASGSGGGGGRSESAAPRLPFD